MSPKATAALLLSSIVLAGCAAGPATIAVAANTKHRSYAWDGLGHDPNQPSQRRVRNARASTPPSNDAKRADLLETLTPNSAAWWAVHDEIEAYDQLQLSKKLVICKACLPETVNAADATGSIPRR